MLRRYKNVKYFSWKRGFRSKCNNLSEFIPSYCKKKLQKSGNLCWVEAHWVRKLVSEAYLAGITCEAFEVERESVQTAKKLFEVVPLFFHELFGHCSKTGRRQQMLQVRKSQKDFSSSLIPPKRQRFFPQFLSWRDFLT